MKGAMDTRAMGRTMVALLRGYSISLLSKVNMRVLHGVRHDKLTQ